MADSKRSRNVVSHFVTHVFAAPVAIAASMQLSGCAATVVEPGVTGGSRADGVVVLSYTAGMLERVEFDAAAALDRAREACARWGYNEASVLSAIDNRKCADPDGDGSGGCVVFRYDLAYQCHR